MFDQPGFRHPAERSRLRGAATGLETLHTATKSPNPNPLAARFHCHQRPKTMTEFQRSFPRKLTIFAYALPVELVTLWDSLRSRLEDDWVGQRQAGSELAASQSRSRAKSTGGSPGLKSVLSG